MKKYKILSILGLYSAFLFIGHHGPLSAMAHAEDLHPLVKFSSEVSDFSTSTTANATNLPQVLGATTETPAILFFNPAEKTYEPTPSFLDEEQVKILRTCISKQETFDIANYEKCYKSIYPRAVLLDQGHTHKKHTLKLMNREDPHIRPMKMRKYQPHTA